MNSIILTVFDNKCPPKQFQFPNFQNNEKYYA